MLLAIMAILASDRMMPRAASAVLTAKKRAPVDEAISPWRSAYILNSGSPNNMARSR
ncbi:hypothetical protein D3C86_1769510 [compost metagenome]